MALEQYPDILTVEELCSVLNIGANSAYELLNKGSSLLFGSDADGRYPRNL